MVESPDDIVGNDVCDRIEAWPECPLRRVGLVTMTMTMMTMLSCVHYCPCDCCHSSDDDDVAVGAVDEKTGLVHKVEVEMRGACYSHWSMTMTVMMILPRTDEANDVAAGRSTGVDDADMDIDVDEVRTLGGSDEMMRGGTSCVHHDRWLLLMMTMMITMRGEASLKRDSMAAM